MSLQNAPHPITSLLVANRGEIARRIIRTCRLMGIRTVVVYSQVDANALFVQEADIALPLAGNTPAETYLDYPQILAAVAQLPPEHQVQAVHPGYGFLSENADFASACARAGLRFVGPSPTAITQMGDKAQAKQRMEAAGVPVTPGYLGDQDPDALLAGAKALGFPVLIKAVAGGGGRGIRLVNEAAEFAEALASAKRESLSAFGNDEVMVERFLTQPRHIEVQVMADRHGNAVHLFERECSVQRRHQKLVEETPSVAITPEMREQMGVAAVRAVQAIDYEGAGTVEFLWEDEAFYFMEMNTRLQVEHPITEMITGLDLVEWQLRIAAGEPLPRTQEEISSHGHAIECRLNAEDPRQGFLPQSGPLTPLVFPEAPPSNASLHQWQWRVDSGFADGDVVSPHYDSLVAKLVVWAPDRPSALAAMQQLLAQTQVGGTATNLPFLQATLRHPSFVGGRYHNRFVELHEDDLLHSRPSEGWHSLLLAALGAVLSQTQAPQNTQQNTLWSAPTPASAGFAPTGWYASANPAPMRTVHLQGEPRLSTGPEPLALQIETGVQAPATTQRPHDAADAASANPAYQYQVRLPQERPPLPQTTQAVVQVSQETAQRGSGQVTLQGTTPTVPFEWNRHNGLCSLTLQGQTVLVEVLDPAQTTGAAALVHAGELSAPLPGKVVRLEAAPGDTVEAGQVLAVIEAMKMEHPLVAPWAGVVEEVNAELHQLVDKGQVVLRLQPQDSAV